MPLLNCLLGLQARQHPEINAAVRTDYERDCCHTMICQYQPASCHDQEQLQEVLLSSSWKCAYGVSTGAG